MKLDVPLVIQQKNSYDCGLAGVSMILMYYGIEENMDSLKKALKVHEGVGTYMPQLGLFLLEKGFKAEIITMNPLLFTRMHGKLNQAELLNYIKDTLKKSKAEKFKVPLEFFVKFMEKGGKITVKVPTVDDIKSEISQKRPLGALVTSNFLLSDKALFNFHFNIITGIDDKFIYVNDPIWDHRGGKQKYPLSDFMFALHSCAYGDVDNASIMKVSKK